MQSPFILLVTWLRLRRGGYQKTLGQIKVRAESVQSAESQITTAKEVAYALAVAIKLGPWSPLCLLRSLTLGWLLGRRGIPFDIRIGIPNENIMGQESDPHVFSAHAWVEHAGIVINDREDIAEQYSVFDNG